MARVTTASVANDQSADHEQRLLHVGLVLMPVLLMAVMLVSGKAAKTHLEALALQDSLAGKWFQGVMKAPAQVRRPALRPPVDIAYNPSVPLLKVAAITPPMRMQRAEQAATGSSRLAIAPLQFAGSMRKFSQAPTLAVSLKPSRNVSYPDVSPAIPALVTVPLMRSIDPAGIAMAALSSPVPLPDVALTIAKPPATAQFDFPASAGRHGASQVCKPLQLAQLASSRQPEPALPRSGQTGEQFGRALALVAEEQTRDLVIYTADYRHIAYPRGDIAPIHGSCSDVVIRAYRSLGIDLQEFVQRAGVGSGDRNIDHRRTETLRKLFTKLGGDVPVSSYPEDYKPGDIVTYYRPYSRVSRAHIAIVSTRLSAGGRPMIVHNRGWGVQIEDALFASAITGHYRLSDEHFRLESPVRAPTAQLRVSRTIKERANNPRLSGKQNYARQIEATTVTTVSRRNIAN